MAHAASGPRARKYPRFFAGLFAAAMAGLFVGGNIGEILLIIFVSMIGSLVIHRVLRSLPVVRNATPDWESWTKKRYFPFGLALSSIVVFYLLAAIWPQG